MPRIDRLKSVAVVRTPRVMQLEGMFDLPATERSSVQINAHLPLEDRPWNIGLIVGPSGCGKTTLARELFPDECDTRFDWPTDRSLIDAFPPSMAIKEITGLLSSVGFSSPPSWLRPFGRLSNGEQFRATLARALAEQPELTVVDEFTSIVDRTVAKIASAAVARTVRHRSESSMAPKRFVAISCHYDVLDWLCPDWTYEPASEEFQWRCERRRPGITLDIARVHRKAWQLFGKHHYLSSDINSLAKCFVAFVEGLPAAFTAVMSFPHPTHSGWREHRTVCLPDYQGVGIGNRISEHVASLFKATSKPYYSTTSHPAMIRHRARSPLWKMTRKPSMVSSRRHSGITKRDCCSSYGRITASFEYVGAADQHPKLDELIGPSPKRSRL